MELQRLKRAVGRALQVVEDLPSARPFQAVRSLFRNVPGVPSTIHELEHRSGDQQCPAQGNPPTELYTGTIEANPPNQPPQNIQNSTEPDTTSTSTSRITNLDSLGFDSLQTSSISEPPSEPVASPPKSSRAVVFDEKAFVAPHIKMDAERFGTWKEKILERLSKDLEETGSGVAALEFYMAGKSRKKLKPTIVITCDDAKSQKHNKKIVEELYWLQPYRLQFLIVLNSQKRVLESFTKPLALPDPSRLMVTANLGSNTNTLCGASAAIKHPRLQIDTPFRLGGMLLVRGEVFCLTVGHITRPKLPHGLTEDFGATKSSQGDSTIDSDDSSIIFTIGGGASDSDTDSISDSPEMEEDESENDCISHEDPSEGTSTRTSLNMSDWTEIGNLEDFTISGSEPDAGSSTFHSDWALIRVMDREYRLENAVQIPGNLALTTIEDTLPENQISVGQVWAVTGSNSLRSGLMSECPAILFLHGRKIRVRQITFEDALVPGDSGAWVIQDGKLCGHVVAGRKGLRWAYMVPIQDIFDEIKEHFNTTDVSILGASMATHPRHGDTIGPRIDRPAQQTKVVDPSPDVSEDVSTPVFRQLRQEEGIQGPSSRPLPQSGPFEYAGNFINSFKRFRPVGKSHIRSPQSSPQQPATSRHSYSSPTIESTHEPPDMETSDRGHARGGLRRNLGRRHVLLIAISGVIGSNLYANDGKALKVAGPGGALVAFSVVGIITIMVMECISEMIQLVPTNNAMVEYVRLFVDEDLAWVVGLGYWQDYPLLFLRSLELTSCRYTYATIFASLAISAAQFSEYWGLSKTLQIFIFFALAPIVILAINFLPIKWFGEIAALAGILKLCILTGCVIFMTVVASSEGNKVKYLKDGFKNNDSVAKSLPTAIFYCIPFIAYGFLGVETVTVVAGEARSHKALTWPSRSIAYLTIMLFFLSTFVEFLNISWLDPRLPTIWFNFTDSRTANTPSSTAVLVLVAQKYAFRILPGLLTGCMIFSVLSASNTALYIASRSLYGIARNARLKNRRLTWLSKGLSKVSANGVPQWAILVSALSFAWLPFVYISNDVSVQDLIGSLTLSGTMSCLLVWACQCLAYIRYHYWLRKYSTHLSEETNSRFNRESPKYTGKTFLGSFQPIPAYIGLFGCLSIVYVCGSSLWWNSEATAPKILAAYGAPIAISVIWGGRKLYLCWKFRHAGILSVRIFVKLDEGLEFVKLLDGLSESSGWEVTQENPDN